jgi:hypothetical protein
MRIDLSEVREENPPRILKNRRRGALVARSHLWVAEVDLRKKNERRDVIPNFYVKTKYSSYV